MAAIIIPPLLQIILDKLSNPLIEKFAGIYELGSRIEDLAGAIQKVQALLKDADGRQVTDEAVRIWLSNLKDAAYQAEDLLQELIYNNSPTWRNFIRESDITRVLDTLQKAASQGLKLNLKQRSEIEIHSNKRETGSFVSKSEVRGREEEKKEIIKKLMSSETVEEESIPVIPIVGIPGIGKTTVAQLVYNDDEVKKYFELRIWVFVSDDEFSVKKIIKAAIESATKERCELSDLDGLQSKLLDILSKKKHLLVLDDVWNEDEMKWDELIQLFGAGVRGSKIVVTTRSQKVALMVDKQKLGHQLKGLPESSSWDLFRKRAFLRGEEGKNHNLKLIGKEIVRKCTGVPLAIKTLGSLMRFKKEEREWLYIRDSELWNLNEYQIGILPALQLSYQHLPSHLKHCFAFCSTFPRNYEIKKECVIQMWIAHGLVLSDGGGNKLLEDIGDEYFNELLWLSFFEDVKECETSSDLVYKINEMFYSLAKSGMKDESVIFDNVVPEKDYTKIRHTSYISGYRSFHIPDTLYEARHLRTLLLLSENGQEMVLKIFSKFIYLRVLCMSHRREMLPMSINNLILLRYLDLSYGHFAVLPGTITSMRSLVTLKLFACYNLQFLPDMGKLIDLRHLDISGCEALIAMPKNIRKLNRLQTLPIFIVPTEDDADLSDLEFLELRGHLKIKHLERVRSIDEAKAAKLREKHIDSLGLCWGKDGADTIMDPNLQSSMVRFQERKHQISGPPEDPEAGGAALLEPNMATEVLECLEPHYNLKNLFVVGYPGFKFPHWRLPNLTKVVLMKCRGCLQLPTLGELPSLKTLHMEEIDTVEYIGEEFYGENVVVYFPSLEELFMQDFPLLKKIDPKKKKKKLLKMWPSADGKEMFPKLRKLTLKKCPNLVSFPYLTSIHHLQLEDCNPEILSCMERLKLLSSLCIQGFDNLLHLPATLFRNNNLLEHVKIISCSKLRSLDSNLKHLTSLRSLTIRWCGELDLFPENFQNLTALLSLEISDCKNLIDLPVNSIEGLRSLRTLSLENCSRLASIALGLQHLTSLEHLTIMYCPSLICLPDTVKYLSALKSLTILSCPRIKYLPEGLKDAITLQSLEIRSCPSFYWVPDWLDRLVSLRSIAISDCPKLRTLPIAVQSLTKLQHLSIQDCPDLQERCKPDTGVDWWMIKHIPHIHIFSSQSQEASTGVASSSN